MDEAGRRLDGEEFAVAVALIGFDVVARRVGDAIWDAAPSVDVDDSRLPFVDDMREVATRLRDAAAASEPWRGHHVGVTCGMAESFAYDEYAIVEFGGVLSAVWFVRTAWMATAAVPVPAPAIVSGGASFPEPAGQLDRIERTLREARSDG